MKFAEKVKYFKKGEQRAEKMLDHLGIDQLEHDTIEYKSNLIKYFFIDRNLFYLSIGFISRANEIINNFHSKSGD